MKTEFRAEMPGWDNRIHIYVRVTGGDGVSKFGRPLTLEELPEGHVIDRPAMSIGKTDAQQLMDELWRVGLRPTDGTGSAGSLAATERHLADMKAIAMGTLGKLGVKVTD